MLVLEPGPGMGFFTLEMARRISPSGRVVAIDIQPKMLEVLARRAAKAGLAGCVECRLAADGAMPVADLAGTADFLLAAAVVHEMEDPARFFREAAAALRAGATLLLVEPAGHVGTELFEKELAWAATAGLTLVDRPKVSRSLAALLRKDPGV